MRIDLNTDEYKRLLQLAALGAWVLESGHEEERPEHKVFTELLQGLYREASAAGCGEWVEEEAGQFFESARLEEWMATRIQDYDNYVFWDELVLRMADRDYELSGGIDWIDGMGEVERIEEQMPLEERWWEEFSTHGLDRLVVDESRRARDAGRS